MRGFTEYIIIVGSIILAFWIGVHIGKTRLASENARRPAAPGVTAVTVHKSGCDCDFNIVRHHNETVEICCCKTAPEEYENYMDAFYIHMDNEQSEE